MLFALVSPSAFAHASNILTYAPGSAPALMIISETRADKQIIGAENSVFISKDSVSVTAKEENGTEKR